MSKRQTTANGFDDEPGSGTKSLDAPKPAAKRLVPKPKSSGDRADDRDDGIHDGIMVYGKIRYNPFCPRCTKPSDKEFVMTRVTSCQGPLAHVACPTEGCDYTTKVSRPFENAAALFQRQQSVAARSDMG